MLSWDAPSSDGGAEITDYEYRIDGRNPWISIGSTLTTHTVTGLINGTEYTFQVRAVNRVGKSRLPSQTVATPEAPELLTLDFTHFVNGDGPTSDLVFVNVGSVPVRPRYLFLRHRGRAPVRRIGGGRHQRSGGPRGRRADGPDGDGTAGRTHDLDLRSGRSGERIGAGGLGGSHRRDAPL